MPPEQNKEINQTLDSFRCSVNTTSSLLPLVCIADSQNHLPPSLQQLCNVACNGHSQATLNEKDTVCDHICPREVVPQLSAPKNGIKR